MNRYLKIAKQFVTDKDYRFLCLAGVGLYNSWDDERYLKRKYKAIIGKELNLDHPRTMNEKLQWIKLYDRKPEYTMLVDKVKVRDYIERTLGGEYLIPTVGVWQNPDQIDFGSLPDKFVLKCNHNSGRGMCICRDKANLDFEAARKKLWKGYKQDYFLTSREWPYKDVEHRIIGEVYMTDSPEVDCFTDYKFYCFDGYVDAVMVCIDRNIGAPKFYFFDKNWELKRYNKRGKEAPEGFTLPKPQNIEKMFEIAEILSRGKPFSRIDLYNSDGKIYFGEITFFPDSGFDPNRLPETDLYFGSLIELGGDKNGN